MVVALAKANAMPAVAVTDRNNLFGALEFAQYASKAGIQPIVGCDLGIRREEEGGIATVAKAPPADWLALLVQNETGYLNLMRLVSRAHLEFKTGSLPALPLLELEGNTEGLLALVGSMGSGVGRLLAAGQVPAATHQLERLKALFDGRLYIELQRHGEEGERRIEGSLLDLAYASGLPLVATNDVHFPKASMYEAHDVLLCIEQGVHIEDPNRRRLTRQHYFKSAAEMRTVFADLPEACDNTLVIAQRCAYMPVPRKPILPRYTKLAGRVEKDALKEMAESGLVAQDHRPRPAALGPAVRALPQSRARVDAGLRYRLLPGQARSCDPLRARRIRPRPCGGDHHLRQAAGPCRAARRRPRAGHALRPGRPHLQAGAQQSGQTGDPGPGTGERAAPEGAIRRRRGDQTADRSGT